MQFSVIQSPLCLWVVLPVAVANTNGNKYRGGHDWILTNTHTHTLTHTHSIELKKRCQTNFHVLLRLHFTWTKFSLLEKKLFLFILLRNKHLAQAFCILLSHNWLKYLLDLLRNHLYTKLKLFIICLYIKLLSLSSKLI